MGDMALLTLMEQHRVCCSRMLVWRMSVLCLGQLCWYGDCGINRAGQTPGFAL